MSLRTWISNLAHRIVGMEADSVNPHVLAAFTDIQWALRELASREEGAKDSKPQACPYSWRGMDDEMYLCRLPQGHDEPHEAAEKPQPVADAEVAHAADMDELAALIARRVAEARAAAREEALMELRGWAETRAEEAQHSGYLAMMGRIDNMLLARAQGGGSAGRSE